MIEIFKFIEKNNHLTDLKINIVFGQIYFNKICGSPIALSQFTDIVSAVMSATSSVEIIRQSLIDLSKNVNVSDKSIKQEQLLFSEQCLECNNISETIDLLGNAENFIEKVFN